MLVRRDVETFEKTCGGVDPDATAAFRVLLAAEKTQAVAAAKQVEAKSAAVVHKSEPRSEVACQAAGGKAAGCRGGRCRAGRARSSVGGCLGRRRAVAPWSHTIRRRSSSRRKSLPRRHLLLLSRRRLLNHRRPLKCRRLSSRRKPPKLRNPQPSFRRPPVAAAPVLRETWLAEEPPARAPRSCARARRRAGSNRCSGIAARHAYFDCAGAAAG